MHHLISSAYSAELQNITKHYNKVFNELDIATSNAHNALVNNPDFIDPLTHMTYIRTQTSTDVGFEIKHFSKFNVGDVPESYYPSPSASTVMRRVQDDIHALEQVKAGKVYGNIFAAKSLVLVSCAIKRDQIAEHATQMFPLTLSQYTEYVNTIHTALLNLDQAIIDNKLTAEDEAKSTLSQSELTTKRQSLLQETLKQLNRDILGPMNKWRDAYMGKEDDKSVVSKREMNL